MLFNSLHFFIFFPVVTLAYFLLPYRFRWLLLLVASCYFYMFFIPVYILILFFTIAVDYIAGIMIEEAQGRKRKLYLVASIIANVGVLSIFKYYGFITENITELFALVGLNYTIPDLGIILPIGLSFHTFQSLSYTIEVYYGRYKAERHLGIFALYVMFYPQLVAGPIERPQNMLHQFRGKFDFDYQRVTDGLKLMAWGLFKKAVIADQLAIVVDKVYSNPTSYDGVGLIIGTLFFAYQIYCDFSGYSDIAIGAAQVMGIKMMTNFRQPYLSASISEFWSRWHISLSTWFRDYLYIPLGGNRVAKWRWQFNLMFVFLVSGLWHGADWSFVIWGGLHGLYTIAANWLSPVGDRIATALGLVRLPRLRHALQVATTFLLVTFAWIFFRADSFSDALYIAGNMFSGIGANMLQFSTLKAYWTDLGLAQTLPALAAILVLEGVQILQQSGSFRLRLGKQPAVLRWAAYYLLITWIVMYGRFGQEQFIYFQF